VRHSTAQDFIARTDIGMSPWPVTKMIGSSMWVPKPPRHVHVGIECSGMHADHIVAPVTQALAGLVIDVDNSRLLVMQEACIRRMVDEPARPSCVRRVLARVGVRRRTMMCTNHQAIVSTTRFGVV
jgi:hypothetical protein